MRSVYFSDSGDDKNDGLSEQTPIYSWKRYLAMKGDDDGIILMGNPKGFCAGSTLKSSSVGRSSNSSDPAQLPRLGVGEPP